MEGIHPEKLISPQRVKRFPTFDETWRFITPSKNLYLQHDQPSSFQPHLTSFRSLFILSSHLCLGLPIYLFLSGFSTKTLPASFLFPIHVISPYQKFQNTYIKSVNISFKVLMDTGTNNKWGKTYSGWHH